jgi:hypothetical protein
MMSIRETAAHEVKTLPQAWLYFTAWLGGLLRLLMTPLPAAESATEDERKRSRLSSTDRRFQSGRGGNL